MININPIPYLYSDNPRSLPMRQSTFIVGEIWATPKTNTISLTS